jgi:signal transduction histidine kinase
MNSHLDIFAEPERSRTNDSIGRTIEGKAKRKDGTAFPVEISLASWKIGSDVYFTAIVRDITHRKHIEQSLQRSEHELKELSSRLLNIHEQERKRIAFELHDGLGQILSAAKIGLKTILDDPLRNGSHESRNVVDNPLEIIQSAIEEVRRISLDLRPSILDDLGLVAALNAFCRDFLALHPQINMIRQIDVLDGDIPEPVKIVIYRVIQEACTNIVRHSRADRVALRLDTADNCLQLHIYDNGIGFNPQKVTDSTDARRGLGLSSMKERVEYSGGSFTLTSGEQQGTMLQAHWPLRSGSP